MWVRTCKEFGTPCNVFQKLYNKPTNNNLRTSSNSRNKTEDTTPRYNNNNQSGQFGNQRTMTVVGAGETVDSQECMKPKRVKDYMYHKEKTMMCKQAKQGVPLQAEQADWLADTDEEIDEQELEAHYSFMAKIQEVLPEESSSTEHPLEQVQNNDENNLFANERQHFENNTAECDNERVALANLIANLTLDTEENKTILKQLKKANASLTQELEECKTNLDETSRALGEATSCRDSCLIALQNKQNELEKYIAFNDRTIDYDILQTKLNETLGLLARKDIDIKEGLKTKAYEISVVNQKHDELVKRSLLTKSQFEGQLKEKSKVISDLKVKEEKDIDKMIEMDKQLKFLNEIVYTRNQSIQTIHMLAPKCSTYNGRPTFANPRYLKKAQSEKPCLYEIPYDTSDLANRFAPNREETMTLANESRSKLNKDYVKPYDYTKQNSLYEIFKAPSLEYLYQLERAKEVRKTMWRKPFVRTKPNIAKNVAFLPVSKSISKSRQVFNDMTFNINQFREIVDQAWFKHTSDYFRVPTAKDMEVLIKTLLMPLSIKTQNDSFRFEHELKTEMHEDYEYVKSLEKEVDELESEKADFSNIYDLLLEECVSKDVTCSYLHSLSDLNAYAELQCLYLNDVHTRTKKPKVVPISASKPKRKANKSVATPHKKTVASLNDLQCLHAKVTFYSANLNDECVLEYLLKVHLRNLDRLSPKWTLGFQLKKDLPLFTEKTRTPRILSYGGNQRVEFSRLFDLRNSRPKHMEQSSSKLTVPKVIPLTPVRQLNHDTKLVQAFLGITEIPFESLVIHLTLMRFHMILHVIPVQHDSFVPFIGIDHHRKCVTLGSGIMLLHEDIPIIHLSAANGIPERFLKRSTIISRTFSIVRLEVVFEPEPLEFEEKWDQLIEDFGLQSHKWLKKCLIFEKYGFQLILMTLLYGLMRTTSRSESENSFFKSFTSPGATLVSFMMSYESAMERQRYTQESFDFKTIDAAPKCITQLDIELHATRVYTRTMFLIVQTEINEGYWNCTIQGLNIDEGCETVIIRDKKPNENKSLFHIKKEKREKNKRRKLEQWEKQRKTINKDEGKMGTYVENLKKLLDEVKADMTNPPSRDTGDVIGGIFSKTKPDLIGVQNPTKAVNKGEHLKKGERLKSEREKALTVAKKKVRPCGFCEEMTNEHTKTTCPLNPKARKKRKATLVIVDA
ncbi:integrase, catalytic region, zinc finger, CCHC-type containing protein [Tanacetum coccineum]